MYPALGVNKGVLLRRKNEKFLSEDSLYKK